MFIAEGYRHATPTMDVCGIALPVSQCARIQCVRVRKNAQERRKTAAFIVTKKRDGHKELFVVGPDNVARRGNDIPQTKHINVRVLASILHIDANTEIIITGVRVNETPMLFSEYQGKGKPHVAHKRPYRRY